MSIKMPHRNSCLLSLTLTISILSQIHARALFKPVQHPLVHTDLPQICTSDILESALKCACFLYHPIYSSNPHWHFLEQLCLHLSDNIRSGERHCHSSQYSTHGNSEQDLEDQLAEFLSDAKRRCTGHATPPETSNGQVVTRFRDFDAVRIHKGKTGERNPVKPRSADEISFFDNETTGEGYVTSNRSSVEVTTSVRQIYRSVRSRMKNFCRVIIHLERLGRQSCVPEETPNPQV